MNDRLDLPLHGLAVYNPRLLSKDELVRFFVARQPELDRLVEALRREAEGQPQHHLVVGARGMGKTTLLNRLRYAIEDDPRLAERCLGLVFPEEQYNVGRLSDFWLNCVDALADVLEQSGRHELLRGLDDEIARIQSLTDADDRHRQALASLCSLADRLKRRLVLLVDNLDLVLDRLPDDEEWALREVLSERSGIQLVGATSAPLESYYRHDKAFYDFFRVHHLQGLSDEDTFCMLRELAEVTGHEHVARLLHDDPARIRTVRLMAGGNPRTVVLLFNLLARGTEGDVRSDLEQLLDLCTPLYKHRLEVLSAQAQRIVDALAMHWDPATAAELAEVTHLKVNAVSTQLDRLVRDGTVEKVALPGSRRLGFQIAERFFNIWCLMRASRRVRRRLVWLVEFLRLMFEPEALARQAAAHLALEGVEDLMRDAEWGFALADVVEDGSLRTALESRSLISLCRDPLLRDRLHGLLDFDGDDAPLRDRAERIRAMAEAKDVILRKGSGSEQQRRERWETLGGLLEVPIRMKLALALALAGDSSVARNVFEQLSIQDRRWRDVFVSSELDSLRLAIRHGSIDVSAPTLEDLESASLVHDDPSIVPCALSILEWIFDTSLSFDIFDSLSKTADNSRSLFVWYEWASKAAERHLDHDQIMRRLNGLTWDSPEGGFGLRCLAITLLRQDKAAAAESAARKAVDRNHEDRLSWRCLGIVLNAKGSYSEALCAYRKYLEHQGEEDSVTRCAIAHCLYKTGGDLENAESLARKSIDPQNVYFNHALTLATILVARTKWFEAEPWIRLSLRADEYCLKYSWGDILVLFAEIVRQRFVPQARALLAELDRNTRWEPLDRALALIETGDPTGLDRIAPEMREAVRLVLVKIAADFFPTPR